MQANSKRTGFTMMAIDNELAKRIEDFKEAIEKKLGRNVSYPFATNLLKNVFPAEINIKKVWINDGKRTERTVKIEIEYLMEEV